MTTIDDALVLAADHGLRLEPDGASVIDAGLDFLVVMAFDGDGQRWVLRIPRRPDVVEGMTAEGRTLDLVRPVLAADGVAVPDWQVCTPGLIAYPALPGSPGLTVHDGEPEWHMDPASPHYAVRLGRLLARLHSVPPHAAADAGLEVRSSEEVRQAWADDIGRVREAFAVAPDLSDAWDTWLEDDSCWPTTTVMTHGEIYPAHVLLGGEHEITGVLDWTTARVDDPARDLAAQYGAAGADMLEVALDAYAEHGGDVHPGLAAQARHLWEASPIGFALYALTTRAESDIRAAAAMLDPQV